MLLSTRRDNCILNDDYYLPYTFKWGKFHFKDILSNFNHNLPVYIVEFHISCKFLLVSSLLYFIFLDKVLSHFHLQYYLI